MNALPGYCGRHSMSTSASCTLPAGHPGPHQVHGYGDQVLEEWTPSANTEAGAA